MSQDELIKLVKSQVLLKKKLEARISELTTSNISLCQNEEVVIQFKMLFSYYNNFLANSQ